MYLLLETTVQYFTFYFALQYIRKMSNRVLSERNVVQPIDLVL